MKKAPKGADAPHMSCCPMRATLDRRDLTTRGLDMALSLAPSAAMTWLNFILTGSTALHAGVAMAAVQTSLERLLRYVDRPDGAEDLVEGAPIAIGGVAFLAVLDAAGYVSPNQATATIALAAAFTAWPVLGHRLKSALHEHRCRRRRSTSCACLGLNPDDDADTSSAS